MDESPVEEDQAAIADSTEADSIDADSTEAITSNSEFDRAITGELLSWDFLSTFDTLGCDVHEHCNFSCHPTRRPVLDIGTRGWRRRMESMNETRNGPELEYSLALSRPNPRFKPEPPGLIVEGVTPTFQYDALPGKNFIRLLKIKSATFVAEPLDCELISVPVAAAPPYDALSYCWGTASQETRLALLSGKLAHIQSSLDEALHRYRRLGPSTANEPIWSGKAEYIWADGVCINQANLAEKAEQVALMPHVYCGARRVYVDLGPVPDAWYACLCVLMRLGPGFGMIQMQGNVFPGGEVPSVMYELPPPPRSSRTLWELGRLFDQPWFWRTWVVQEVAVPRCEPLLMFGRYTFGLEDLFPMMDFIRQGGYEQVMLNRPRLDSFSNLVQLRQIRVSYLTRPLRPLAVMEALGDFLTLDPRDRVYGVMSLWEPEDRLVPDYDVTVNDVYSAFAVRVVKRGDGGRLLNSAGLHRRTAESHLLPTWVPDWREQFVYKPVVARNTEGRFNASGSLAPAFACIFVPERSMHFLKASASLVDTLHYLSHPFRGDLGEEAFLTQVEETQNLMGSLMRDLCATQYADVADAFTQTLLMGDSQSARPARRPGQRSLKRHWFGSCCCGRRGDIRQQSPEQDFAVKCMVSSTDKRLAVSRRGLLALVPPCAQVGDLIALLAGSSVPHMLRPANGSEELHFLLVGGAYVHGIMEGEVLKWIDYPFKDIIIE